MKNVKIEIPNGEPLVYDKISKRQLARVLDYLMFNRNIQRDEIVIWKAGARLEAQGE